MGWLFGKKKKVIPRVPFPEGRPFDEKTLQFSPEKEINEEIIEPSTVKEAVGINKTLSFPEENEPIKKQPFFESKTYSEPIEEPITTSAYLDPQESEPLFIKVDVYQRILGEFGDLKKNIAEIYEINRDLENSEYNEENNFENLKKSVKVIHDRLLQADKIIFKGE